MHKIEETIDKDKLLNNLQMKMNKPGSARYYTSKKVREKNQIFRILIFKE